MEFEKNSIEPRASLGINFGRSTNKTQKHNQTPSNKHENQTSAHLGRRETPRGNELRDHHNRRAKAAGWTAWELRECVHSFTPALARLLSGYSLLEGSCLWQLRPGHLYLA